MRQVDLGTAKESRKTVLVCDDEERREKDWARKIERVAGPDFRVTWAKPKEFVEWIKALDARRQASRSGGISASKDIATGFDTAAIVFIDYDLLRLEKPETGPALLDGESLAYLVRCYSQCGVIVALNRYGSATSAFDLTLRGHPESYADFGIGSDHIAEPGLWGVDKKGLCSWSWPLLPDAVDDYQACLRDLENDATFGHSILKFLGFSQQMIDIMPRAALEFLARKGPPSETTFASFVEKSGNGLRGKDKASEEQQRRIAAARIRKWLARFILNRQDIIVDAPHLVSRFASLLDTRKPQSITAVSWKRMKTNDLGSVVAEHAFPRSHWLSCAGWFWPTLRGDERIGEVSRPWDFAPMTDVFCEDISRFLPRRSAREFVADVGSPFVRRFVVDPTDPKWGSVAGKAQYEPTVRFWMAD